MDLDDDEAVAAMAVRCVAILAAGMAGARDNVPLHKSVYDNWMIERAQRFEKYILEGE